MKKMSISVTIMNQQIQNAAKSSINLFYLSAILLNIYLKYLKHLKP